MQSKKRLIRGLGGLLLLVACFIASQMQARFAVEQLWGYRPLFFYLSCYGGLLALFFPLSASASAAASFNETLEDPHLPWQTQLSLLFSFFWPKGRGKGIGERKTVLLAIKEARHFPPLRCLLLASISGLLLGLGFPGYGPFPFLLWVAFVPLFLLRDSLQQQDASYRTVFFYGFHAFLLFNILATYWVTNTAFGPGVFAVLANSLLMSLPWLLFHFTARHLPKVVFLSFPAYWLVFEWMHYHWELNWPWLTLGNGLAQFPILIQWYEYTGVLGGSLWILLLNSLIYLRLKAAAAPWPKASNLLGRQAWLLLLLLPMALSVLRYKTYLAPASEATAKLQVTAIQPNFEPHFEKFSRDEQTILDTFLLLSKQALAAAGPTDYLIFPETSFSYVEERAPLNSRSLQILFDDLSDLPLRYLLTGFDGYYRFQPGEVRTKAVRSIPRADGSVLELEAINGALQLDLTNGHYQTYRKGVFVPGAESFPFRDYLGFAKPLVDQLGGSIEGRGTQSERTPLVGEKAKIAPVICYESVFGEFFTGYIQQGAQAAFVMTNDGWWDNTAGHLQHLYISSVRAIETRRDVVRSANMGACAFIDQRGKIKSRTKYGEMGYLNGSVQLNDQITPYVRHGDVLARISLLLSLLLVFSAFTKQIRQDK